MNYSHWTDCNLLPADEDDIISPDIFLIVHKAKVKSIYLKRFLPQLHIIRFQKRTAVVPFPGTERTQLYYVAAPKLGTHTWFPEQLSAMWRRSTVPWGLKWTLIAPRERQFAP